MRLRLRLRLRLRVRVRVRVRVKVRPPVEARLAQELMPQLRVIRR